MERAAQWDQHPVTSFAAFISSAAFRAASRRPRDARGGPLADGSLKTYTYMFGKFAGWMADQGKHMSTIDAADIVRFIELGADGVPDLNSKIAYRYMRLLERCYEHLQASPNPATAAIRTIGKSPFALDEPTQALSREQLARFLAALPTARPRGAGAGPSPGWKQRRTRVMQLLMALAGLKVAEVIGLLTEEIGLQQGLDHSIEIQVTPERKHSTSFPHTTFVDPAGVAEVLAWRAERAQLGIPGPLLFPANHAGGAVDKAWLYRQVRATFELAGVAAPHAGGRTLRNTFARHKLDAGTDPSDVREYLGLALERSIRPYKNARTGAPDEDA